MSVVHSTRYVAVANAKDWDNVVDDDDEIFPSDGSTSIAKREC